MPSDLLRLARPQPWSCSCFIQISSVRSPGSDIFLISPLLNNSISFDAAHHIWTYYCNFLSKNYFIKNLWHTQYYKNWSDRIFYNATGFFYDLTVVQSGGNSIWRQFNLMVIQSDGHSIWRPFNLTVIQSDGNSIWRQFDLTGRTAFDVQSEGVVGIFGKSPTR